MPLPTEAEPRPPADFASALATAEPIMLVGGQAVNLWALYYHDQSMEFAPFVSRDADVLGDRATLEELAKLAGVKPQFFPLRPPSNEVGVTPAAVCGEVLDPYAVLVPYWNCTVALVPLAMTVAEIIPPFMLTLLAGPVVAPGGATS